MKKFIYITALLIAITNNCLALSLGDTFLGIPKWVFLISAPTAAPTITVGSAIGGVSASTAPIVNSMYRISIDEAIVVREEALNYLETGVESVLLTEFLHDVRTNLENETKGMSNQKLAIDFITSFDAAFNQQK